MTVADIESRMPAAELAEWMRRDARRAGQVSTDEFAEALRCAVG